MLYRQCDLSALNLSVHQTIETFLLLDLRVESDISVTKTFSAINIAGNCCGSHIETHFCEELLQVKVVETSSWQVSDVDTRPGATIWSLVTSLGGEVVILEVELIGDLLHSSVVDLI